MSQKLHYFIAIPLSQQLRQMYSSWQLECKKVLPYRQWTHRDDLHVTLKFLGPLSSELLRKLDRTLTSIQHMSPFSVQTGDLGTFGQPTSPRVLWIGVDKKAELLELQKRIEKLILPYGFLKVKRLFFPHITIAKKWDIKQKIKNNDFLALQNKYKNQKHVLYVNKIVLYRVQPKCLPKYEKVQIYELSGDNNGTTD